MKKLLLITVLMFAIPANTAAQTDRTMPAEQVFNIVKDPTDLPGPIKRRLPKTVQIELEAIEVMGQLDNETSYWYWTFNGTVPGPMVRVRVDSLYSMGMIW